MQGGLSLLASKLSSNRKIVLFFAGGLLGVLAFLLIYGISPLDFTNDTFCRGGYVEKDIQQHYAGWLFYRQSDLRFPFCVTQNLNYPDGLSVAYTDSIPLFAAFFRLLSPILPDTFQYFGLFTLLCFFLQGAFGALLTRPVCPRLSYPTFGRSSVCHKPGPVGTCLSPHCPGSAVFYPGNALLLF